MPIKAKGKKKQSRLAFAPLEESPSPRQPASPSSSSAFTPSKLRYSNPFTGRVTVKGQLQLKDYVRSWGNTGSPASHDDDELGGAEQSLGSESDMKKRGLIKKSEQFPRRTSNCPQRTPIEVIPSDDEEVIRPSKRRRIQIVTETGNEPDQGSGEDNKEESDNTNIKSDAKMPRKSNKITPRRRSQRLNTGSSPVDTPSRSKVLKTDFSTLAEPEESAADELASTPTNRKRRGLIRKPKSSPIAGPENSDSDSDSDLVITGHKRRKQDSDKMTEEEQDDKEDASEDEIVAFTPSRRNSRRSPQNSSDVHEKRENPRTPNKLRSEQDGLDLEEDLEDLRDTVLREKRTRGAVVNSARSTRQKHLDMLRRRRAGEKVATDSVDVEEDDDEPQQYSSNTLFGWHEFSRAGDVGEDSDLDSVVEANADLDADDSSFVEDDGDLGVPVDVPFEFSRHRTKSTRDCFRDVVEWMVHSKLNPAFRRDDDMYQFAFRKLDDEVVGRAGSQMMSSVWNADFTNTLRARPYMDVTAIDTSEGHSCAACNRSGHPASSELKFTGKPYSDETLEPLHDSDSDSDSSENNENEDDDDDDDAVVVTSRRDRDREGHELPREGKPYYLGKTCKSNAVLTHTLIHWRFHLYEWVVDYLNRKEELLTNPQRSLDREKLSAKKRTKYANQVVDHMDTAGEVQKLWTDFHMTIRTVRELKNIHE